MCLQFVIKFPSASFWRDSFLAGVVSCFLARSLPRSFAHLSSFFFHSVCLSICMSGAVLLVATLFRHRERALIRALGDIQYLRDGVQLLRFDQAPRGQSAKRTGVNSRMSNACDNRQKTRQFSSVALLPGWLVSCTDDQTTNDGTRMTGVRRRSRALN